MSLPEGSSANNIENHKFSSKNGLCLDLSCQSLQKIQLSSFAACTQLQFLYLQGNLLEKLENDFFCTLISLRHLDLRQNKLRELPASVGGHSSLEVLLLQDNELSLLPCELGQVPRLRKLQFSGNPLTWPPEKILSQGLGAILSYLRGAFMDRLQNKDPDEIPKGDGYDCTKDTGDFSDLLPQQTILQKSAGSDEELLKLKPSSSSSNVLSLFEERNPDLAAVGKITKKTIEKLILKGQSKQLKDRANSRKSNEPFHDRGPSLKPYVSPGLAQTVMNGQCYPLGYKKRSSSSTTKVYKTLLQKLWINQLKCVLQSQESILQKKKSSEALRQWRQDAKAFSNSSSQNWSGLTLPYDFDPNHLKMVSRSDWQFQNKSLEKKGNAKPNATCVRAMGLEEKVNQILRSFDEMKSKSNASPHSSDADPSTRCKLLAEEMKRISQLQKAVQALRLSA